MEKYLPAASRFTKAAGEAALKEMSEAIVARRVDEKERRATSRFLYNCLEVTSLRAQDSRESIRRMVETVNAAAAREDSPTVAAICVYPRLVAAARETLTAEGCRIVSVAGGFPSSQTFIEVKIAETALAVADGADEIDVVLNLGAFFEGDYREVSEELLEIKAAARGATLKVILETGLLPTPQDVKNAAVLAIYSGADFLKTSTGKNGEGASPEAFCVMCDAVGEYYRLSGKKIGVKAAGGIATVADAVPYYNIVKEILGEEWLSPTLFRLGSSSLAKELLREMA